MLKYFAIATLCCLPLCAVGQCGSRAYASGNSAFDIRFAPQDARAAFMLSAFSLDQPHAAAPRALPVAAAPVNTLSGPELAVMLPAATAPKAALDAPALPLARSSSPAATPELAASLHAALLQAELQVQADRLAQKEMPARNRLGAIPGSAEAHIVPVEKRRRHGVRRITSLTAFSQPVLLPNEKMMMPATLTSAPMSQAFVRPIPPPLTAKPHFLQAVATPGTAFAALADAPVRQVPHSVAPVRAAVLPSVVDPNQAQNQD